MKILFITRKYPPQIGGMEAFSYGLLNNWPAEKKTIILNKSQRHLIWWLPYALLRGFFLSFFVDVIHLGDAILAPLGAILKIFKPVVCTVHGLDITWPNKIYQRLVIPCLRRFDKIICVSHETANECKKRGITKIVIIPNGIDTNKFRIQNSEFRIQNNKKILLSVGRLVKRKGFGWFIKNVIPSLPDNFLYLIAGQGPDKIETPDQRVKYLGVISDSRLAELYHSADLMVMPNIFVPGDREGFGIVALEAASCGLPVLASGIEGLKEAIIDGKNGFLVESGNREAWTKKIQEILTKSDLMELKERIKQFTADHFSWPIIITKYKEELQKLCPQSI